MPARDLPTDGHDDQDGRRGGSEESAIVPVTHRRIRALEDREIRGARVAFPNVPLHEPSLGFGDSRIAGMEAHQANGRDVSRRRLLVNAAVHGSQGGNFGATGFARLEVSLDRGDLVVVETSGGKPRELLGMSGASETHGEALPRASPVGRTEGFAASRHVNRQRWMRDFSAASETPRRDATSR